MSAPETLVLPVDIAVFRRLLACYPTGAVVSADDFRAEFDMAQMSSAAISSLFRVAQKNRWLVKCGYGASRIPSRDGGGRYEYRITGQAAS